MKPTLDSRRWLALLMSVLLLVLAACERPLQDEDELPTSAPPPATSPTVQFGPPTPILPTPTDTAGAVEQATPAAGEQPEPSPDQPTTGPEEPTTPGQPITYLVQAGDTLSRIAQQYNVSVDALAQANNLLNIHSLEVGQTLIIPVGGEQPAAEQPTGEQVHVVRAGENLYRIALQYGLTFEELAAYNGIANPNRIEVGQTIRIPPSSN